MDYYIYTLSYKGVVRYVGQTKNPSKRYREHTHKSNIKRQKSSYLYNWISSINKEFEMDILDIVSFDERDYWEIYWISQIKSWGFNLVNATEGGYNAQISKETGRKIALSNTGRRKYPQLTKDLLYNEYIINNKKKPDIALEYNVSQRSIKSYLKRYKIFK